MFCAAPAWAYQVEQYDPPPDDELVCSICRGVFCDPIQTPCRHVFCRACVNKWLDNNNGCPICRKRMTKRMIVDVVPLVKSLISKLSLRCHNSERGCKTKVNLDRCEPHLKECEFEVVRCENAPCKVKLMRRDIPSHEKQCPHHHTQCKICCMNVSSMLLDQHNCVKTLKRKIKGMDKTLMEKDKKIKELQDEIKDLKENHRNYNRYINEANDSSSSISADDVIIDHAVSDSSSMDSASYLTDDEDNSAFWLSTSDILEGLENSFHRRVNNSGEQFADVSIEYPRTSSPTVDDLSSVVAVDAADSTFDEEPRMRRPAKRRHPTHVLDSSDEENEALELPSLPSPKRSWQLFPTHLQSSSQSACQQAEATIPSASHASVANSSRPSNSSAPVPKSKTSCKQPSQPNELVDATFVSPGRTMFQRTLSLLEQYNLESDPEWLPTSPRHFEVSDDSLDQDALVADGRITSSDESSLLDTSSSGFSDTSDEDAPGICSIQVFNSRYSDTSDSSTDPDWEPA